MKLSDAIRLQKDFLAGDSLDDHLEVRDAIELGVRALEELGKLRLVSCSVCNTLSWPLYGEDPEGPEED